MSIEGQIYDDFNAAVRAFRKGLPLRPPDDEKRNTIGQITDIISCLACRRTAAKLSRQTYEEYAPHLRGHRTIMTEATSEPD